MPLPRIYSPNKIQINDEIMINSKITHYVHNVLRMNHGDIVQFFNNTNLIFNAKILKIYKTSALLKIISFQEENRESPLHIHLGQVITRGYRIKFAIQKSIELGVNIITPLFSERCGVKINPPEIEKKIQSWKQIAIATCTQCGRNLIPQIRFPMKLEQWCAESTSDFKINFAPNSSKKLSFLPKKIQSLRLLIGPEGGLSDDEIAITAEYGFTNISLGTRILRTETASITVIAILQAYFGDLT
ncbi:MAG: 16S rRNA (uracil(1498)-N(3))-methyltransferase [Candidatus Dasytiphilus stammeri]